MTDRKRRMAQLSMGWAVEAMIVEADRYCCAYRAQFEAPIGDDFVLGESMEQILAGLSGLLNGDLGECDGATLSRALVTIAQDNELEEG